MFKLKQSQTFFWPVEVSIPVDGGKYEKQTFDAEFKRLPQARLDEIFSAINKGEQTESNDRFCKEVVVGWKGVNSDGEDVPFSETSLDLMLNIPQVAYSIVTAFFACVAGEKRKNS